MVTCHAAHLISECLHTSLIFFFFCSFGFLMYFSPLWLFFNVPRLAFHLGILMEHPALAVVYGQRHLAGIHLGPSIQGRASHVTTPGLHAAQQLQQASVSCPSHSPFPKFPDLTSPQGSRRRHRAEPQREKAGIRGPWCANHRSGRESYREGRGGSRYGPPNCCGCLAQTPCGYTL